MAVAPPDITALNSALVNQLKAAGIISTPRVEAAFRAVPRHLFVPTVPLDQVYRDEVIVTKRSPRGEPISSCEQPAVVAVMLEQLRLEPGHRVLEIGTGTGHVAALLAQIVGETGQVTTIDIQPDLVDKARTRLVSAGFPEVRVLFADGGFGCPDAAPFDRIILTVGSSDITPAWWEQLKPGGRLVLPLYLISGVQQTVAFEKTTACLSSLSAKPCGFMPLQGAFAAERPNEIELSSEPGLSFVLDNGGAVDAAATFRLLSGPSRDLAANLSVTLHELIGGLGPWLTLHERNACGVTARGAWLDRARVPHLVGLAGEFCSTDGIIDGVVRLALLARPSSTPLPAEFDRAESPFALRVRSYGPDDTLARRLIDQVGAWAAVGRPAFEPRQIRAYPRDGGYVASAGEYLLPRPSTLLVLSW